MIRNLLARSTLAPEAPPAPAVGAQTVTITGTTPTSTGIIAFESAGFGTPQAAVVFMSQANTTNNPEAGLGIGVGFTDGTNQNCSRVAADDNVIPINSRREGDNTTLVSLINGSGSGSGYVLGVFDSWSTNGINIDFTTVDTVGYNISIMLIKGCNNVYAGKINLLLGVNNITAPNFKGNLLLTHTVGVNSSSDQIDAPLGFGAAHNNSSDVVTQGAVNFFSVDGQTPEQGGIAAQDNCCVSDVNSSSIQWKGVAEDFDSEGFSINTGSDDPANDDVFYLLLDTGDTDGVKVSVVDSPTSTGAYNIPASFTPQSNILAMGSADTINSLKLSDPIGFSLSMFDATNEYNIGIDLDDAANPSNSQSHFSSSNAVELYEYSSGHSLMHQGSFTSFDGTGTNLNFPTTVDSTARKWLSVAFKAYGGTIGAVASGSTVPNVGENTVVIGGDTTIITLSGDTWVAAGATFDAQRQAIIDGVISAGSEIFGWNNEVRDKELVASVVRTSDTVVTITWSAAPFYDITVQETITITIPAAALTSSGSPIVVTPTFTAGIFNYIGNDVDWDNPPPLEASGPISVSNTFIEVIRFKVIDGATLNGINATDITSIVIENCWIKNCGNHGMYLLRCSGITIRNCKITDTNGNQILDPDNPALQYHGQGIYLDHCYDNVLIKGNWLENNSSGIHITQSDNVNNYTIISNYCKNPSALGLLGSQGNFIQITYSSNMANTLITQNVMTATVANSNVFDWINIYRSRGVAGSPVTISYNKIWGSGDNRSGGGIIIDMGTPDAFMEYISVINNTLIDPGGYGIGLTAGSNMIITGNDIFSSRNNSNILNANVGLYIWRIGEGPGDLRDCTIGNNNVLWWSDWYNTGQFENGRWLAPTGKDGYTPNHGPGVQGDPNVNPADWATNDWSHSVWDADGGNQGYTDLYFDPIWKHAA